MAVIATGLVLATTLVIAGIAASFSNEVTRSVTNFGADRWIVKPGVSGPMTASTPISDSLAKPIADLPGVRHAEPLILMHYATTAPHVHDINLVGVQLGGMLRLKIRHGKGLAGNGQAVVDDRLGATVGTNLEIGGRHFRVVGTVRGISWFAGTPAVFIPFDDARAIDYDGKPLATTWITEGVPAQPPPGLVAMTNRQVIADTRRPTGNATASIDGIAVLLWLVAIGIVGSIVYLSALERLVDFAVFRAMGMAARRLFSTLVFEAVALTLSAAVLAAGMAKLLAPLFPLGVEIPRSAFLGLPALAVAIGILASGVAMRRAVTVDPALAFAGA